MTGPITLLDRLHADARAALVDADEYLDDARWQRGATERICEVLTHAHGQGTLTARERKIWLIAVGVEAAPDRERPARVRKK